MTASYRASLIRRIKQEMGRVDAAAVMIPAPENGYTAAYEDGKIEGQQQAYSHVLWLLNDTEDL